MLTAVKLLTRAPPRPTWDMKRSTVLYTCNNTGMHDVQHAVEYGTVVYDWSTRAQPLHPTYSGTWAA